MCRSEYEVSSARILGKAKEASYQIRGMSFLSLKSSAAENNQQKPTSSNCISFHIVSFKDTKMICKNSTLHYHQLRHYKRFPQNILARRPCVLLQLLTFFVP